MRSQIQELVQAFGLPPADTVESLEGAGGYSGAKFWKVVTGDSTWCLRRWPPEHPDDARLAWLHQVLFHAAIHGFTRLPVPRRTLAGKTWLQTPEGRYELVPWIPGQADFHARPSANRLRNAMHALAAFHQAVREFPRLGPHRGPVPAVLRRREMIQRLEQGGLAQLTQAVARWPDPEVHRRGELLLAGFRSARHALAESLELARTLVVDLQPCIRDLWHDHLFFMGEEVSGIVDFGAMQIDHVSVDLARLLGSLVADDQNQVRCALDAYCEKRPLSDPERRLVGLLDRTAVFLSGINWLEWICVERRVFEEPARVFRRLDELVLRIRRQTLSG